TCVQSPERNRVRDQGFPIRLVWGGYTAIERAGVPGGGASRVVDAVPRVVVEKDLSSRRVGIRPNLRDAGDGAVVCAPPPGAHPARGLASVSEPAGQRHVKACIEVGDVPEIVGGCHEVVGCYVQILGIQVAITADLISTASWQPRILGRRRTE